jgi:DASS family divalent anion:Na+ symporter
MGRCARRKSAWDTLIWFGALVMLAEQLNKTGVVKWFSDGMRDAIIASGMGWFPAAAVLLLVFVFHTISSPAPQRISAPCC